jgi:hypothetical protein
MSREAVATVIASLLSKSKGCERQIGFRFTKHLPTKSSLDLQQHQ